MALTQSKSKSNQLFALMKNVVMSSLKTLPTLSAALRPAMRIQTQCPPIGAQDFLPRLRRG